MKSTAFMFLHNIAYKKGMETTMAIGKLNLANVMGEEMDKIPKQCK